MTETDATADKSDESDGTAETNKTERLRSVFLSVIDAEAEPMVESQREDSHSWEIREEQTDEVIGPAEHHGLDDVIDDPNRPTDREDTLSAYSRSAPTVSSTDENPSRSSSVTSPLLIRFAVEGPS